MKNQWKVLATTLAITAAMFSGAVSAAAQTNSAISVTSTGYRQEILSSKPSAPIFETLVNFDGTNGWSAPQN